MRIKYIISHDKINGNFDFIELVILKNIVLSLKKLKIHK